MALWKARSSSPEPKVKIVEEDSGTTSLQTEESGTFVGDEDFCMTETDIKGKGMVAYSKPVWTLPQKEYYKLNVDASWVAPGKARLLSERMMELG